MLSMQPILKWCQLELLIDSVSQYSSGVQAIVDVAVAIKARYYDIGIGAGFETITANFNAWDRPVSPRVCSFIFTLDRKAAAATAYGKFKDEIIPIKGKIDDPKTRNERPVYNLC